MSMKVGDRVRYWDRRWRWWVFGVFVHMDDAATAVIELDREFRTSNNVSGRVIMEIDRLRPASRRRRRSS